ncbi:MAG: NDP-sugar synthase, partial [Candidatus Subteraquimicrobiales bacterium]|nr:NDP-sugar synthase [Candidatus Subteraquimicrobiales bacterium]
STFKYIPRGFVSLAEVIHSLLKKGQKVYGYLSDDYWLDIGTPERYTMANWDILDSRVGLEIPGTEIEKGVWIQKGAQLNTRVQFFAPVVIGAGVIIRAKAELGPYVVVGADSFIDIECVIRKSILFNDVFVGKDTLLERCIVEDNFTINPLFEGRDIILTT